VDCSNLNYDSEMNTCYPETLKGQDPFELYFATQLVGIDELTVGVCNSSSRISPRTQFIVFAAPLIITVMTSLF